MSVNLTFYVCVCNSRPQTAFGASNSSVAVSAWTVVWCRQWSDRTRGPPGVTVSPPTWLCVPWLQASAACGHVVRWLRRVHGYQAGSTGQTVGTVQKQTQHDVRQAESRAQILLRPQHHHQGELDDETVSHNSTEKSCCQKNTARCRSHSVWFTALEWVL